MQNFLKYSSTIITLLLLSTRLSWGGDMDFDKPTLLSLTDTSVKEVFYIFNDTFGGASLLKAKKGETKEQFVTRIIILLKNKSNISKEIEQKLWAINPVNTKTCSTTLQSGTYAIECTSESEIEELYTSLFAANPELTLD